MGAVDNIFPHHQNEIAQTEAFTGKTFSKYWVHGEHLLVDGKKMSKSANNFYTLRQLYENLPNVPETQVARALRLLVLSTNYRETFNFTFPSLTANIKALDTFDTILDRLRNAPRTPGRVRKEIREFTQAAMLDFVDFLEDDINTPSTLARVYECINDMNRILDTMELFEGEIRAFVDLLKSFDSVFGLFDFGRLEEIALPLEVQELIAKRDAAKFERDFASADTIRTELESLGYLVADTKSGTKVQKK